MLYVLSSNSFLHFHDLEIQIKPLIEPTRLIMKVGVRNYEWHEIFPEGLLLYFIFSLLL